jgi:hypothetical protein
LDSLLRRGQDGKLKLRKKKLEKPVVLILGSGWGAHSCMKVGFLGGGVAEGLAASDVGVAGSSVGRTMLCGADRVCTVLSAAFFKALC